MPEDLSAFIETADTRTHLRVERELGDGYVLLRREEAERRQAAQDIRCSEDTVIELLRNSRDAGASMIFVATMLDAGTRRFCVLDNGCGIPAAMHEMVFEPRVTTKLDTARLDKWGLHGRGMALYSVKCACTQAKVQASAVGLGCSMVTASDVAALPEKVDQSSFPRFVLEDTGKVKVSGPKNIMRACCEFALEHRGQVNLYVGSASEVAATLLEVGVASYSVAELSLKPDMDVLPLIHRPAFTHSPEEFAAVCNTLGLRMSARTARRIIDGEIAPLRPVTELIREALEPAEGLEQPTKAQAKGRRPRMVRLNAEERARLSREFAETYAGFAERYYLDPDVQPEVRVSGSNLTVSIPLRTAGV
ncbi:MAG: ATP-binding protein [Eggerthellaceae bacterium]|nr:ATP-binding protein [Eggerthellaceae bacterium]